MSEINKTQAPRGVSQKSFAARWNISDRYCATLIADGVIPSIKLGRKCLRIPLKEADDAFLSMKTGGVK